MIDVLTSRRFWRDFEWFLPSAALLLSTIGVLEIYSSTLSLESSGFATRQMVWVGIGAGLLLAVAAVDYRGVCGHAYAIYGVSMAALLAVGLFGVEVSGSRSWFQAGGISIQPSEFAKLAVAIALARYFSGLPRRYLTLKQVLTAVGIVVLPMVLIALQPDLGTALTYVPILAFGLFVRGVSPRVLLFGGLVLIMLLPLGWYALEDYQKDRLMTFVQRDADPLGSGYQIRQSMIAIGSGGLWGSGLFQGSQNQLGFLPTRHTDFIFSVVAEELGFAGVVVTLTLLFALVLRSLTLAAQPRDTLGLFLVVCLTGMFVGHIVINVGMVIDLLPSTGIPLPFLSYGGSSTVTAYLALGLVVSVRRCRYVN